MKYLYNLYFVITQTLVIKLKDYVIFVSHLFLSNLEVESFHVLWASILLMLEELPVYSFLASGFLRFLPFFLNCPKINLLELAYKINFYGKNCFPQNFSAKLWLLSLLTIELFYLVV